VCTVQGRYMRVIIDGLDRIYVAYDFRIGLLRTTWCARHTEQKHRKKSSIHFSPPQAATRR
jgi:hypothetical protein